VGGEGAGQTGAAMNENDIIIKASFSQTALIQYGMRHPSSNLCKFTSIERTGSIETSLHYIASRAYSKPLHSECRASAVACYCAAASRRRSREMRIAAARGNNRSSAL
jgi:hypothetical protein